MNCLGMKLSVVCYPISFRIFSIKGSTFVLSFIGCSLSRIRLGEAMKIECCLVEGRFPRLGATATASQQLYFHGKGVVWSGDVCGDARECDSGAPASCSQHGHSMACSQRGCDISTTLSGRGTRTGAPGKATVTRPQRDMSASPPRWLGDVWGREGRTERLQQRVAWYV